MRRGHLWCLPEKASTEVARRRAAKAVGRRSMLMFKVAAMEAGSHYFRSSLKTRNKGQVNWGGVRKTALKRYTKSRSRGSPKKNRKGVLIFAPGGWGGPPDTLERRGKRDSRNTHEQPRLGQSSMVIPLPRGGGKPQIKNPWGDDQT